MSIMVERRKCKLYNNSLSLSFPTNCIALYQDNNIAPFSFSWLLLVHLFFRALNQKVLKTSLILQNSFLFFPITFFIQGYLTRSCNPYRCGSLDFKFQLTILETHFLNLIITNVEIYPLKITGSEPQLI